MFAVLFKVKGLQEATFYSLTSDPENELAVQ